MKALPQPELTLNGRYTETWHVRVNPAVDPIENVWRAQFWTNCINLKNSDVIRIEATDGSYDFNVRAIVKMVDGKRTVRVAPWPNLPQYVLDAAEYSSEMLPVMLNGKALPRVEYARADGWRVIGLDGQLASNGHDSEAAANVAMSHYIAAHGITSVADRPATDVRTGEEVRARPAPQPAASVLPTSTLATVLAGDPNLSVQKRKEAMKKQQKQDQVASDLKALADRKAAAEAEDATA